MPKSSRFDLSADPGRLRELRERWVIVGQLELVSAAHLGNGETGDSVDLPLLRDRASGAALLTGSSLAGALRNYVNDRCLGFRVNERHGSVASKLFGGNRGDDDGSQSPLIVFDSLSTVAATASEIRDGVAIDPRSGTAASHLKFDCEILPAGTTFPLRLELLVEDIGRSAAQLRLLATALSGLERGEIRIGARKNRGLGECRARQWRTIRFDFATPAGWGDWLKSDHELPIGTGVAASDAIATALSRVDSRLNLDDANDQPRRLRIDLDLGLPAGMLIRSPGREADSPDAVQLRTGPNHRPILSGTSLAGVMRSRALRIARIVRAGKGDGDRWVQQLFGTRPNPSEPSNDTRPSGGRRRRPALTASRLLTTERPIDGSAVALRPARIRVDRFTGGVVDGALFDEEPVFGGTVRLSLEVHEPQPGETGLLLLVLKDFLTGDLPVGGTSSIGRGVMIGRATVRLPGHARAFVLDPATVSDAETTRVLNSEVCQFHSSRENNLP